MRNSLDRETSPYLLQHAGNPVHWQPWGEDAFRLARDGNRPILLSVGYAACHWCHVMAHESFEDAAIAGLMNASFVNVKVDREERPDVDAIYQHALALLGQPGGWPLTMFLTPAGEPFWGGTYFPPAGRFGRPGFAEILQRVAEVYRGNAETVAQNAAALLDGLRRLDAGIDEADAAAPRGPVRLTPALLDQVARALVREVDPFTGGIGSAPKFPQPYAFQFLLRAYLRSGLEPYRRAVEVSLDHMCQGGMYDHLAGGFARYATDDAWLVPHFEKMLYDNAQLLDLLTLAWQAIGKPLYAERAAETAGWLLDEMVAPDGGFASSLDADSEGEEGRYYVWSELEVNRLLGAGAVRFKQVYDVSPGGNWEGRTILNRLDTIALLPPEQERLLAGQRAILLAARRGRVRPAWDDKVLADWNGLTIVALVRAGMAFGQPAWLQAAGGAFDFVVRHMTEHGRLKHSYRAGRAQHVAMLDDYANLALAALLLHEATGEAAMLAWAQSWTATALRHYWDRERGGFYFTADDAADLLVRRRHAHDNAVPAGNGVFVEVLARLWCLTGEHAYRERAEAVLAAFAPDLTRHAFAMPTLLNGFELLANPVQIVLAGAPGDDRLDTLAAVAWQAALPSRVIARIGPDDALPASHPAHGKRAPDGRACAYVCVGNTCSAPVGTPAELASLLAA